MRGFLTLAVAVLFFVVGLLLGRVNGYVKGYKEGQIDAISGNRIVYCLKDTEINETVWKMCEE